MEVLTSDKIFGGSFLLAPIGSQPQFTPEDLSDEAKAIGEAARDFMLGEVIPADEAIDKLDIELTKDLLLKAGELGLLSIEIPEAYEGMDLDKKTTLVLLEEVGKQASFSVTYGAHTGIGTLPIVYFGSPEQKAKYLPMLGSGQKLAAYALTEAGSGSDAMGAKTTAVLDGDEWVLNGSKMWITNAGFADVFVVFAKVDGRKFSAFIVEKDDPGFSTGLEEHKLGIKGSSTRALSLDNCRIPKDRLLGEVGRGHRIAFGILTIGRFKLGAGCTGTAKVVLEYTIKYTGERHQFGKPLHSFGLIQAKLADMATRVFVGEAMNFRTISYIDDRMQAVGWDQPDAAKLKLEIMDEYAMEASISQGLGQRGPVRHRRRRGAGLRRLRLLRRVPAREDLPRQPHQPHLRGHQRDQPADHRRHAVQEGQQRHPAAFQGHQRCAGRGPVRRPAGGFHARRGAGQAPLLLRLRHRPGSLRAEADREPGGQRPGRRHAHRDLRHGVRRGAGRHDDPQPATAGPAWPGTAPTPT